MRARLLALVLLVSTAHAHECGHGPVTFTVVSDVPVDCNHCGPQTLPGPTPSGYERQYPTMCTTMACPTERVTTTETWTDWPECGGKRVD